MKNFIGKHPFVTVAICTSFILLLCVAGAMAQTIVTVPPQAAATPSQIAAQYMPPQRASMTPQEFQDLSGAWIDVIITLTAKLGALVGAVAGFMALFRQKILTEQISHLRQQVDNQQNQLTNVALASPTNTTQTVKDMNVKAEGDVTIDGTK